MPETASAAECSFYEQSHPNFILDGAHLSTGKCTTCASCHIGGVFLGTPKSCVTCHNGDPARSTVARSSAHPPTALVECSNCHITASFTSSWGMNHAVVSTQRCDTCHIATYSSYNAQPKDSKHIPTTADCVTCHAAPPNGQNLSATLWNGVSHATIHAGITTGCISCHDNNIAIGKASYAPGHPVTSDQCELCHSVNAYFKCASAVDKLVNYAMMWYDKIIHTFA